MKLWIDDERPAPSDDFVVCRDIFEVMNVLAALEDTDKKIEFISFDYYIDPKNNRFTGMDAVNEVAFFDQCVWPILNNEFTFATHSSDSECNRRMTEQMNEYLNEYLNEKKA